MPNDELSPGEPHPSAKEAMRWLQTLPIHELMLWQEAFASTAIESSGNRLADICLGTIDRLLTGKPVSDRYLLGLAWVMRYKHDQH